MRFSVPPLAENFRPMGCGERDHLAKLFRIKARHLAGGPMVGEFQAIMQVHPGADETGGIVALEGAISGERFVAAQPGPKENRAHPHLPVPDMDECWIEPTVLFVERPAHDHPGSSKRV